MIAWNWPIAQPYLIQSVGVGVVDQTRVERTRRHDVARAEVERGGRAERLSGSCCPHCPYVDAVVISADLIHIGDQFGFLLLSSAAIPAMCGPPSRCPESASKFLPRVTRRGHRGDDVDTGRGDVRLEQVAVASERRAVATRSAAIVGAPDRRAGRRAEMRRGRRSRCGGVRLDRAPSAALRCTVGHGVEVAVERVRRSALTRTMPTPPAFLHRQGSCRRGRWCRACRSRSCPYLGRVEPGRSTSSSTGRPRPGRRPRSRHRRRVDERARRQRRRHHTDAGVAAPLPRVTVFWSPRSWVLAATVVTHGALWCDACSRPGRRRYRPTAATKTPAAAALKNGMSVGRTIDVGRTRDRVVDHVDTVGDGFVDRGHEVGGVRWTDGRRGMPLPSSTL